jgi:hypothetical protein
MDISAFVGSWVSDMFLIDRSTDFSSLAEDFRNELLDTRFPNRHLVAQKLKNFIEKTVGTTSGEVFQQLLRVMIGSLRSAMVIASDDRVSYLQALARLSDRQDGLTVATLNYDTTVETMCRACGTACSTGIEQWSATSAWDIPSGGVRLLKLHGSINWDENPQPPFLKVPAMLPQTRITLGSPDNRTFEMPAIVFGQTKLRPDGPFIELLLEFARALEGIHHLVVVGYSFRDEHVNEQIRRWINADLARRITVIDPEYPASRRRFDGRKEEFRDVLRDSLIPSSGPNVRPDWAFEPRLEVVRSTTKDALGPTLEKLG